MANTSLVKRLPMARDLNADDLVRLDAVQAVCRQHLELRGYRAIETPLLEQTELFLRKSGGELASRLYSFTDPGGYLVSLRPEFTAPVIRHVIEVVGIKGVPLRFHYAGPVFRYPTPGTPAEQEPGVFVQAGAELIGGAAPFGDGEIISTAWSGLAELGVREPRVSIGHVGLLWDLLKSFGLSDRAQHFLVQSVGKLRSGKDALAEMRMAAQDMGLFRSNGSAITEDGAGAASVEAAESLLSRTLGGPIGQMSGARTAEEIMARLARKLQSLDDEAALTSALNFMATLSAVRGPVRQALKRGRAVARAAGQDDAPFEDLAGVVEAALSQGVPEDAVTVDLGLVRDIAYYTGSVFDLTTADGSVSLGGGGRYDGLMYSLGAGEDIPAIGFAYNLDAVVGALPAKKARPRKCVLVAPKSAGGEQAAAKHAAELRAKGTAAVVSPRASDAELRRAATACEATEIVRVAADGSSARVNVR